jgi:hypothetical protein
VGVSGITYLGSVTISTTSFNYAAVASQYSRNRTVYVERHTLSKDRTVMVAQDIRKVYVEARSTTGMRTSSVPLLPRKAYMYRKTTSSDRSVLVA